MNKTEQRKNIDLIAGCISKAKSYCAVKYARK